MGLLDNISRGELMKMEVYGYTDSTFKTLDPAEPYKVAINPETLTESVKIDYSASQGVGDSATELVYSKTPPGDMKFELLFDSTGVLSNQKDFLSGFKSGGEVQPVSEQVAEFTELVTGFLSDTHAPRFLKFVWGDFEFRGRTTSWSVTYTLFHPDGKPIRAKGTLGITHHESDELRTAREAKNSPDLTHVRSVRKGDTLPGMCNAIYGDPSYYPNIAQYNNLNHFRSLTPGSKIYFPPLAKTTE